ncbi:MAG TPA: cupredoxin domain-containing protein [Gaiellaceae bacterium]|jgi:plastocyanin|nr:cupredoxin domain-containing protein [Gaiellaceae bacterium]
MKRMLLLPLALVATLVVAAASGAATKTVQITGAGFTPTATTVSVGDSVTWHNADNANHQVVANDGSFASPVLKPGDTYTQTFNASGKTNYHDALATKHTGSVTVTAPAANVTLTAATQTIVYGSSTKVSGAVTNQLSNEPVTLTSQPYGKGTQSIASQATGANGSFAFGVSPTIQTSYQAHWKTTASPSVTINVAPRVGFGLRGRLYIAKVTSDLNYAGHFVLVQKRNAIGTWKTLKRVYLGGNSNAAFRLHLARGRTVLRLALPESQAGAGYVQGISHLMPVFRR